MYHFVIILSCALIMINLSDLPSKVPEDSARYHIFRFKHNYEGDSFDSNGNVKLCDASNILSIWF